MKPLTLFLFALLTSCIQAYPAPTQPEVLFSGETFIAYDLKTKTIALVEEEDGEAHAYCSGVWLGVHHILTAAHCTEDSRIGEPFDYVTREDMKPDMKVYIRLHEATLVKRDYAHDLAMLYDGKAPSHGIASLGLDPYVGQPVYNMGHPLGLMYMYSSGVVSSLRLVDGVSMVTATAAISPGCSGGGLFDEDGRLIGVTDAYFPRGELLNLFVHVSHIRQFVSGVL